MWAETDRCKNKNEYGTLTGHYMGERDGGLEGRDGEMKETHHGN